MAEVRLRKDFYGALIPKVSSDSLRVNISFSYQGPAQTLDIETNTGKRGAWGDYDQESPAYHDSKAVSASDTPRSYTFSRYIPLSFWGSRQIDDGAVEVVIRGTDVYDDAVLWNAYKIAPTAEYTLDVSVATPAVGYVTKSPNKAKYSAGETVTLTAHLYSWAIGSYVFDHWGGDASGNYSSTTVYMDGNKSVIAYFKEIAVAKYALTTEVQPPGSGRVEKDPDKSQYNEGESVTVWGESAYPFDHWSGDAVGTVSPYHLVMNYNKHVVAWFTMPGEYTLDVGLSHDVGYVTVSPDKPTYSAGETVTLTAYLDPGQEAYWYLDHWTVNGVARAGNPISITMDRNTVVTAQFIWWGAFKR